MKKSVVDVGSRVYMSSVNLRAFISHRNNKASESRLIVLPKPFAALRSIRISPICAVLLRLCLAVRVDPLCCPRFGFVHGCAVVGLEVVLVTGRARQQRKMGRRVMARAGCLLHVYENKKDGAKGDGEGRLLATCGEQ